MSILVFILKIIGILLLILLFFAGLFLFHPIYYQIKGEAKEDISAEGYFWWLFQILRLEFQVGNQDIKIRIRIFGRAIEFGGEDNESALTQAAEETSALTEEEDGTDFLNTKPAGFIEENTEPDSFEEEKRTPKEKKKSPAKKKKRKTKKFSRLKEQLTRGFIRIFYRKSFISKAAWKSKGIWRYFILSAVCFGCCGIKI